MTPALATLPLAADVVQQATDPSTLVILGVGGVFIIYVMMRMTKQRKKRDPFDKPFAARSVAQERSVQRGMENLLVELSEMTRQLSAQLETKAAKLEALIADADERAARLKAMLERAPARPAFDPADPPPAEKRPEPPFENLAPAPTVDPQHAEVYRLADEGRTPRDIAADLGRPSGEVELILALRPRA